MKRGSIPRYAMQAMDLLNSMDDRITEHGGDDDEFGRRDLARIRRTKVHLWRIIAASIIDTPMPDDFKCVCGNQSHLDGFFPCDEGGWCVDPTPERWPQPLWCCDRCKRIYRDTSHEKPAK